MPNFVVMSENSAFRTEWIDLLKVDFPQSNNNNIYNYFDHPDNFAQRNALTSAQAVFLIVSINDSSKEINNATKLIQNAYNKGLNSTVPLYLVISGVSSQENLEPQITKKMQVVGAETHTDEHVTLYQAKLVGKNTSTNSSLFFCDVFGYSGYAKYPFNLKQILTHENLQTSRRNIKKKEEKKSLSTPFSSSTALKKPSSQTKTPPLNIKEQTHGYNIVLNYSSEKLSKNIKVNELRLALDEQDFLWYSVIDPQNTIQTHKITIKDFTDNLKKPHTYRNFVTVFKQAVPKNDLILLSPFLSAIFAITKKAGHTKSNTNTLSATHGRPRSNSGTRENTLTLTGEYVLTVRESIENIDENLPANELRIALGNDQTLHYAIHNVDGNVKTGVIDSAALKTALKTDTRFNEFFTLFAQALKQRKPELLKPFRKDILAEVSKQGCKLTKDVESSKFQNDSNDKSKTTNRGSNMPQNETQLGLQASINSEYPAENSKTSQQSTTQKWHKSWALKTAFLTFLFLAIAGFILEVAIPAGFLAPSIGFLATAIAGTFLATLTPVGVFILAISLTALLSATVAFYIQNNRKEISLSNTSQNNRENKKAEGEEENIEMDDLAARNNNHNLLENSAQNQQQQNSQSSTATPRLDEVEVEAEAEAEADDGTRVRVNGKVNDNSEEEDDEKDHDAEDDKLEDGVAQDNSENDDTQDDENDSENSSAAYEESENDSGENSGPQDGNSQDDDAEDDNSVAGSKNVNFSSPVSQRPSVNKNNSDSTNPDSSKNNTLEIKQ